MSKIFVIGFNKTATTTFHKLFLENKLKSQHSVVWKPNQFRCFSDCGDLNNFKKLDKKYPSATFILNIRSLDKWLISRIAHGYRVYLENHKPNWAYPCNANKCKSLIEKREKHHLELLKHFKDRPRKLIIVNIEKDNWEDYISTLLGFNVKNVPPQNVNKINNDKNPSVFQSIGNAFKKLKYNEYEKKNILLRNGNLASKYIKIYRNNIL